MRLSATDAWTKPLSMMRHPTPIANTCQPIRRREPSQDDGFIFAQLC
jgi:hypothetical protein